MSHTAARRRAEHRPQHPADAPASATSGLTDRFRAPMQQDVRLAPHDAGRRTRRIEQHRVERLAVPPDFAACSRRRTQRRIGLRTAFASMFLVPRSHGALRRRPAPTADDGSRSSRCAALPPGAAQASSTRAPGAGDNASATSCAAPSWTETSPSAKPGSADTATGRSMRNASGQPPGRRWKRYPPRATVGRIRRVTLATRIDPQPQWRRHARWRRKSRSASSRPVRRIDRAATPAMQRRDRHSGKPSRCARRNNALTMPAWCGRPSARVASTVADRGVRGQAHRIDLGETDLAAAHAIRRRVSPAVSASSACSAAS